VTEPEASCSIMAITKLRVSEPKASMSMKANPKSEVSEPEDSMGMEQCVCCQESMKSYEQDQTNNPNNFRGEIYFRKGMKSLLPNKEMKERLNTGMAGVQHYQLVAANHEEHHHHLYHSQYQGGPN
jgi:hypothetical protein